MNKQITTLGGGCFWCLEAAYQKIPGVLSVTSGYAGGSDTNPTYRQVCSGATSHAEVVQVEFNDEEVSFPELLSWFWKMHDPTTKDRQGNDVGPQYRSIILTHDDAQREIAEESKKKAESDFSDPIVTEIKPLETFYPAEDYHQDYYQNNPAQPYCSLLIGPKLQKLGLA